MNRAELRSMIHAGDDAGIDAVPREELAGYVRTLLDEEEAQHPAVNADRLMSDGVGLARAGQDRLDEEAIAWLAARPLEARLDVAALLLSGLWKPRYRHAPVRDDEVRRFLEIRQQVAPGEEAEYSAVNALVDALGCRISEEARALIASALREVRGRRNLSPRLHTLISRALESA